MDDLVERIKASLETPNGDPWFPELTADLAARAWDRLHRDIALTPDNYGTERVLSRSISAPREIVTSLSTRQSNGAAVPAISIERLTQECAVEYQEKGVCFYSPDEILNTTVLPCVEDALAIIDQVPSLMRTVAALVQSLHVIKPEDEDHDVSFSEPHVPFSIFVSVPEKRIANDALRIAEAIVHEAMHLQLTLIERIVPLTSPTSRKYYSPWRRELRNAQGLVHALYVFSVIDRVLGQLTSLSNDAPAYAHNRQREIRSQTSTIENPSKCADLTALGISLVRRLTYT